MFADFWKVGLVYELESADDKLNQHFRLHDIRSQQVEPNKMNFPSLPTDNLYKFIALSGFVLGVLSWGYLIIQIDGQEIAMVEINAAVDGIEAETESNAAGIESLARELGLSLTAEGIADNFKGDRADLLKLQLRAEAQALRLAAVKERRQNVRLRSDLEAAKLRRTKRLLWPLIILGTVGFGLSIFGFFLWYFRVQRYQDQVLKAEAKQALAASTKN